MLEDHKQIKIVIVIVIAIVIVFFYNIIINKFGRFLHFYKHLMSKMVIRSFQ